jgi:hypothetical protein
MANARARMDLCISYLVCADARISHEADGDEPLPEKKNGKDTGRISHSRTRDGVVLFFKGEELRVKFT